MCTVLEQWWHRCIMLTSVLCQVGSDGKGTVMQADCVLCLQLRVVVFISPYEEKLVLGHGLALARGV